MFTVAEIKRARELSFANDIDSEIGFEFWDVWITNPFLECSARFEFINYGLMCNYYGKENIEMFIQKILSTDFKEK